MIVSGTKIATPLAGADLADVRRRESFYGTIDNSAISGLDFVAGQSVTVGTGRG